MRGSALQLVAFAAELGTALFLMPFLIHSLGDRDYGVWIIIGTIIGQVGLLDLGLAATTQRFIANALGRNATEEISGIYSTSIILFWVVGLLALLVVAAILPFASFWFTAPADISAFRWALLISGVNAALGFPFMVVGGLLTAKLRINVLIVCGMVSTVTRLLLVYLAVQQGYGIVGVALADLGTSLANRALLGFAKWRLAPEVVFRLSRWEGPRARELIHFGKYVLFLRLGTTARSRLNNLLIAPLIGLSAVTHYAVAVRLSDYFQSLVLRVVSLPGPIFARHAGRGEGGAIRENFLLVSEICASMCGIAAAGVLVFGERFIALWLGPGYGDSYAALVPLTLATATNLLQTPTRDVLGAIYKHPFDAKSNAIEAVVSVILTLVLLHFYGILGAALGTAIPMIVVKGYVLPRYVCRQIELPARRYLRAVLPPLGVAVIAWLIGDALLPLGHVHSLLALVTIGALFAACQTVLTFLSLSRLCRTTVWSALFNVARTAQAKSPC